MYRQDFPDLEKYGYLITSPLSPEYNCIAWAAGDSEKLWWPDDFLIGYWPEGIPRNTSLEAFILMFSHFGYFACDSEEYEDGYEKIAIYILGGEVTHAARQLDSGEWTSKLGLNHDIKHTLLGLNGPCYGEVAQIMKRPKG